MGGSRQKSRFSLFLAQNLVVFHMGLIKFLNFFLFANKKGSFGEGVPILAILSIFEALGVKKVRKMCFE